MPARKSNSGTKSLTGRDSLGLGSPANHGFEQQRSVPSDIHFCEQFASLWGRGAEIAKTIFFKYE